MFIRGLIYIGMSILNQKSKTWIYGLLAYYSESEESGRVKWPTFPRLPPLRIVAPFIMRWNAGMFWIAMQMWRGVIRFLPDFIVAASTSPISFMIKNCVTAMRTMAALRLIRCTPLRCRKYLSTRAIGMSSKSPCRYSCSLLVWLGVSPECDWWCFEGLRFGALFGTFLRGESFFRAGSSPDSSSSIPTS